MKVDVSRIAKLASLPLKSDEKKKQEKQLEDTLTYIENLDEVDTKNIEPTPQVTGLENVSREDETAPSLSQDDTLKNSKSTHNGFFKVKGVLNNE